jgi:hypothetical protein
VELGPETRARLAAEARAQGLELAAYVASLLEQQTVAPPSVPVWPKHTRDAFHAWLEEFTALSDKIPALPGETFSREMIYGDHD